MIVAVVMVMQQIEGCSDREAADRFAFDARWKYAVGGLDFDYPGFVPTVMVDPAQGRAQDRPPDAPLPRRPPRPRLRAGQGRRRLRPARRRNQRRPARGTRDNGNWTVPAS
jgi:hypothetical protein